MDTDKKEFDSSLKRIVRSSFIVLIGLFLSKLFTFIYRVIIVRKFSLEVYGLFSLAMIFSGWIIVVASIGLPEGLLKFIPGYRVKNEPNKIKYLFKKSLNLFFITSILGGILLFFSADILANKIFHNEGLAIFLKLFSLSVPLSVILSLLSVSLRAHEEVGWYSFINNILISLLNVVLILVLLFFGFGEKSIIFSYIFAILAALLVAVYISKKKTPQIFGSRKTIKKIPNGLFREMLIYSWPLLFTSLIWRLFSQADSFMIGIFRDAEMVGIYNTAVPIAFLLQISSQIFMQLFFPIINKEYSKNNLEIVSGLSKQVGKWIYMINLPLVILLLVFPGEILSVLFGKASLAGATALSALSIGVLIMSVFSISNRLIAMIGKSKLIFFDVVIASLINILLNIPLVKNYGITGAAVATSISFLIMSSLFAIQAYKTTKIVPFTKKVVNITLAGIVSWAALFYSKSFMGPSIVSLITLSVLFIILYLFLLFIFKVFDKNDLMILASIRRKIHAKKDVTLPEHSL